MEYVKKSCPACGKRFIVIEDLKDKELYCTINCISMTKANSASQQRKQKLNNIMKNKKLVITGGLGFIGSNLVNHRK